MKKIILIVLSIVIALLIALGIVFVSSDEDLPEGEQGAAAEQLTDRILDAVNKEAWDSLGYIQFRFQNQHMYLWDVQDHQVLFWNGEDSVLLDPNGPRAKKWNGDRWVRDSTAANEVFESFCNDAFWLQGYTKLRDPGTERRIVADTALLVTYNSGGVTPGDSYLWMVDEQGLPRAFKMWVSILPVGGVKVHWEDWRALYNGAMVPERRYSSLMEVSLDQIEAAPNLEELGFPINQFAPLGE